MRINNSWGFCIPPSLQPISWRAVIRIWASESGVRMTHASPLSKQACLSTAAAAAAWTNTTLIIDQNQWEADRESIGWRLLRSGTTASHVGSDLDLQRGRGARLWKWDGRFQSDYLAFSAAGRRVCVSLKAARQREETCSVAKMSRADSVWLALLKTNDHIIM